MHYCNTHDTQFTLKQYIATVEQNDMKTSRVKHQSVRQATQIRPLHSHYKQHNNTYFAEICEQAL